MRKKYLLFLALVMSGCSNKAEKKSDSSPFPSSASTAASADPQSSLGRRGKVPHPVLGETPHAYLGRTQGRPGFSDDTGSHPVFGREYEPPIFDYSEVDAYKQHEFHEKYGPAMVPGKFLMPASVVLFKQTMTSKSTLHIQDLLKQLYGSHHFCLATSWRQRETSTGIFLYHKMIAKKDLTDGDIRGSSPGVAFDYVSFATTDNKNRNKHFENSEKNLWTHLDPSAFAFEEFEPFSTCDNVGEEILGILPQDHIILGIKSFSQTGLPPFYLSNPSYIIYQTSKLPHAL